jgi:glycosyltransferase involved in cell wall biosynthesis
LKRLFDEALRLGADIVVTLDADGQHDPSYIPKLVEPVVQEQADIVIGSRYLGLPPDRIPLYRKIGLKIIGLFHKPVIRGVKDTQSGFRAYHRKVVEVLAKELQTMGYGTETEQLFLAKKYNWQILEVPVSITYATERPSKKHPIKHGMEIVRDLLRLVTEERPLLVLGVPGTLLFVVGLVTAVYAVWIFNHTRYFSVPLTLISIAFIFLGTLLEITALVLYALSNVKRALLKR